MLDGTGAPLATLATPTGFVLSYVHSINLSPVDEEFSIGADGILTLERMSFDQMSTGMPSGDGEGFAVEGGRYVTRPGRRMASIPVRVSPVPGHRLTVGGRTRPLTRWGRPGDLLVLETVPAPTPGP